MTLRVHLFPYRTQKLSSVVPKILGWRRPGKIGRCQHKVKHPKGCFTIYSSIAQSVVAAYFKIPDTIHWFEETTKYVV